MSSSAKARGDVSAVLSAMLSKVRGVVVTQKLNSTNFTVKKKVFAFTKGGAVVLKLPVDTVGRLVRSKKASLLVMGKRTMKEWVVIEHAKPESYMRDLPLFEEAIEFVKASN